MSTARMSTRRWRAAVALGIAATAVGGFLGAGSASSPEWSEVLVVDAKGTVSLIDTEDGSARFEVPDAVVSPDRSTLFSVVQTPGATTVESRSARTGELTGVTTVPGALEIRSVSPEAGAIALMEERPTGLGLYEPTPRTTTSITVAYTDERPSRVYDLEGNYEVETFAADDSVLYLLEFQPAEDPEFYLVRELDLASGLVDGVRTPQVELRPEMRGVARAQQVAPDGKRLYTLYSLSSEDDPVHDLAAGTDTERWAFVHVLDLEAGTDYCIFLLAPIGTHDEASVGLGLSPNGEDLWVADPSTALIAHIDTMELAVTETFAVPHLERRTPGRAEVAASDDGNVYLGLGSNVYQYAVGEDTETPTLELTEAWWTGRFGLGRIVQGLAVSADDRTLFITSDGEIVLIDRVTGEEVSTLRGPDGEDVTILGPPTGAAVKIPLECAC